MPALLLRTYYGSIILQFDTGSTFFILDSHKLMKFMDKFCSPFFVCLSLHISRGGGGVTSRWAAARCCAGLRELGGLGGAQGYFPF